MLKKFKEEFIKDSEKEENEQDDFSEVFTEQDGKIVKNLFSNNFIKSAKN